MNALPLPSRVALPSSRYAVVRLGFQQYACLFNGYQLDVYSSQRYAANRAHRHFAGLGW